MRIEIAVNTNDSTKDKGDLLEQMASDFLSMQNYQVDTEIRKTGMELDLLCKKKTNQSKIIYIECKAYDINKKIDSTIIKNLVGTRTIEKYQEAWLVSTSDFGKDAKGLINEIEKGDDAQYFTFYTPEKLITAFIDSTIVCEPAFAKREIFEIIDDQNKIGEEVLLITDFGRFWIFKYLHGGKPHGVLVAYAKDGKVVREEKLLDNLRQLQSSLKDLDFLQIQQFKDRALVMPDVTFDNIKLSPDYIAEINEIGLKITHPNKESLSVNDVFIFPDLEDIENENEVIKSQRILDLEGALKKCIIFGGEVAGKTTLAYEIQKRLNDNGLISIYVRAEQIKNASYEKFINVLLTQYKKQYSTNPLFIKFFEDSILKETSRLFIVIDDFELLKIKNSIAKDNFLRMLKEKFVNVLVFANKSVELETLANSEGKESFKSFKALRIKQFGHRLRDDLIDKWLMLGDGEAFDDSALLNKKIEIAGKINFAVGTNFVPTYPLYLLTMLQLMEEGSGLKLQGSSYAELYRYLINQSLGSVNAKPEDLDFFHTYLSFLAHYFFVNRKKELSKSEMMNVYKEYCLKMDIGKSFKSVNDLLCRAKLIKYDNNIYRFNHSYSYYYFVAKYLSDNINESEVIQEIDNIIDKIYKSEFANIIIFFIHHAKYNNIIDKILNKSSELFSTTTPYILSADEMNSVNSLIHKEINLYIDDQKVSEKRKATLERMDNNKQEEASTDSTEDEKQIGLFSKINLSMKLIEILGQIATSYYGSINGLKKAIIIDEICSLGLRSLRVLLEDFKSYIESIKENISIMIDQKKAVSPLKKEEIVNRIIYSIQEMFVFIFIKKICDSLASKNLFISSDKIAERNNTPAGKIISMAVRLNFPGEISADKLISLDYEFNNNFLAKRLLKLLTIEHLYKFEVQNALKQKICEKLNIKVRKKLTS